METGHIIPVTGQIDINNTAVNTTRAVLANIKLPSLPRTHTHTLPYSCYGGFSFFFSSMLFLCWFCFCFFVVFRMFFCWTFCLFVFCLLLSSLNTIDSWELKIKLYLSQPILLPFSHFTSFRHDHGSTLKSKPAAHVCHRYPDLPDSC